MVRTLLTLAQHALVVAVLLSAWQWASNVGDDLFYSSPIKIGTRLYQWSASGLILFHLRFTLYAILAGFLIGASSGLVLGFVSVEFERLGKLMEPYILGLYGIPRTALAPLLILWFGIGLESKVAQAALMAFFIVFFNTFAGLKGVDKDYVDMCRSLGAGRWQIVAKIKVPSAFPYIITGLRIAIPQALLGAVVAEFIASNRGIGYLVAWSASMLDSTGTFAALFTLMVVTLLLNYVLTSLERKVLRWRAA